MPANSTSSRAPAVVPKTPAGLMLKRGGRSLLRPVCADQSELPLGFFGRGGLIGQTENKCMQIKHLYKIINIQSL